MVGKADGDTQNERMASRFVPGAPMTRPRDEFDLIGALAARFGAGSDLSAGDLGIGDDAAAVTLPGTGRVVLATDLVVAGVHVDPAVSSPGDIGWKALMVTVSDLAAMGCAPSHVLLSVAAPAGFDVQGLGIGVAEAAEAANCSVVGGDLSSSPLLVVSVAAVGPADDEEIAVLTRSGARPGDHLFATGPLGASAAGLRMLGVDGAHRPGDGAGVPGTAASAHRRPVARIREGVIARSVGASACIDVSDGLAADVTHLADQSDVGLELVLGDELVAPGADRDEALHGGEDYELVIATPDPDGLRDAFRQEGLRTPLAIGRCLPGDAGRLLDGRALEIRGWRHRF